MTQLPRLGRICDKRFSDEPIKVLLQGYCRGVLSRAKVQEVLGVGNTCFFTISYRRTTGARLSAAVEAEIRRALLQEKEIVENRRLPISGYNYSAVRGGLFEKGVQVSLNTIISRAKELGCYRPRRKRKAHEREAVTAATCALLQHDASTHLLRPFSLPKP